MASKMPLIMKDGTRAFTLTELKEHFDIEKLIEHFSCGRLLYWLEQSHYADEANAVRLLNKDDPDLPDKLCMLFGITYQAAQKIDVQVIENNSSRLARLKQLTDDEDVLQNVDMVAFTQTDLEELYRHGAQKIYLCDGNFQIPEFQRSLHYVLIGTPQVDGLFENTSDPANEHKADTSRCFGKASSAVSDLLYRYGVLGASGFIETNKYIIVNEYLNDDSDDQGYYRIDKLTGEKALIYRAEHLACLHQENWAVYNDLVVFPELPRDSGKPFLCNLDTLELTRLPSIPIEYGSIPPMLTSKYIAILNKDNYITILTTDSDISFVLSDNEGTPIKVEAFVLYKDILYYIAEEYRDRWVSILFEYSIPDKKIKRQLTLTEDISLPILVTDDRNIYIYTIFSQEAHVYTVYHHDSELHLGKIIALNHLGDLKCFQSRYLVYIEGNKSHDLCVYDLQQAQLTRLADTCVSIKALKRNWLSPPEHHTHPAYFSMIGQYIYYERSIDSPIYRISIDDLEISIINDRR